MESAAAIVPWFLQNMPAAYFNQIPEATRRKHLKAVLAIRDLKQTCLSLKIETKGENGSSDITFISSETRKGTLHQQITELEIPANSRLSRVKVFSSNDGDLALNVFSFESTNQINEVTRREDAQHIFDYIKDIKAGVYAGDASVPKYSELFSDESMNEYLTRITPHYAIKSTPRRLLIQRQMFEEVRHGDGVAVHMEAPHSKYSSGSVGGLDQQWLTIAASNVLPEELFRLTSSMIKTNNMNIVRSHLDTVSSHPDNSTDEIRGSVSMLRLLVSMEPMSDIQLNKFKNDIKKAKWLDNKTLDLGLVKYPWLGLEKAEIITALCSMLHGPLCKKNQGTFSSTKSTLAILDSSPHFIQIADSIASLFMEKFDPKSSLSIVERKIAFDVKAEIIRAKCQRLHLESARILLSEMLDATGKSLRTNFFNEGRYALSIRVDPTVMVPLDSGRPQPFGVFFIHGRHFNGFHNRFRDIARGGLRIVTPPNSDQHAIESSRQYDEAYGLSYAQQLKNKDIPEGGSKGVCLVDTPSLSPSTRFFEARICVRAYTDALLDLIVKPSVKNLVDFYGKEELIYLGPDEQIIPSDIDWICNRAAQRGYPIPAAFMSSKKGAGINHKEFGVTSEGVAVFLGVALKRVLNIDPVKDPFTVKITGGPDGDVAGNLIRILYRDFGENAKVVGIADGFGVAEDPNGLDSAELSRLVKESLPITSFNRSKLSPTGIMMDIVTEEGLARRLSMCFRVKADVFVPAGGRPNTINIDNWKQFLDPTTGKPSSPLIVEGANIFTTQEARDMLFKHGNVTIVKDSSANKCGVITSSNEVATSMLLSKEEFLDVKAELVADVLVNIRILAKLEAELLFKSYNSYPGPLPHFSERISNAINLVTDAITDHLEDVNPSDPLFRELLPLVKQNLPKKLASVAWDRAEARFPVQYQKNSMASTLASQLVYQEGIHLVEAQPPNKLAERAIMYYRANNKIMNLVADLEKTDFGNCSKEQKSEVLDLLRKGGPRTSLGIF